MTAGLGVEQRGRPADGTSLDDDIFLTGATGFLGAHLLHELLERSDSRVTCMVRGKSELDAKRTLSRQLRWYFPDLQLVRHESRLKVVVGDMEAEQLGLSRDVYQRVAESHAVVLNAAADVNHVGAASRSFRINTDAVAALLELARAGRPKAMHHISTASVQGEFAGSAPLAAFQETHLEEGQVFSGPYPESKYRAEVLMRAAFARGAAGAVYRVGYVGPHSVTGRYQRNIHQSNTARYVRACVRLSFAPYLPDETVQLTPVDSVAQAVVALMSKGRNGQTYYIDSPQHVSLYDVVRVLHAAGYPIRLIDVEEFVEKASRLSSDVESLTVVAPSVATEGPHAIPTDSSWSQQELARLGFEYPRVTSAWLGKFLQHAIEVGFIEAPRFWNVAPVIAELI